MNHCFFFSPRVLQVDTAHSKIILIVSMFFHEMKSRDSLIKELAIQKAKIDIAFKAKLDQNQNVELLFESGLSNNAISQIQRKSRFIMNECSNRSKKCCENLDNEARHRFCEAAKKRMIYNSLKS